MRNISRVHRPMSGSENTEGEMDFAYLCYVGRPGWQISHCCPHTLRTLFEILLKQTEISLYLPFFDLFGTKRTSVWIQINPMVPRDASLLDSFKSVRRCFSRPVQGVQSKQHSKKTHICQGHRNRHIFHIRLV